MDMRVDETWEDNVIAPVEYSLGVGCLCLAPTCCQDSAVFYGQFGIRENSLRTAGHKPTAANDEIRGYRLG
jgi:hypothetical protein